MAPVVYTHTRCVAANWIQWGDESHLATAHTVQCISASLAHHAAATHTFQPPYTQKPVSNRLSPTMVDRADSRMGTQAQSSESAETREWFGRIRCSNSQGQGRGGEGGLASSNLPWAGALCSRSEQRGLAAEQVGALGASAPIAPLEIAERVGIDIGIFHCSVPAAGSMVQGAGCAHLPVGVSVSGSRDADRASSFRKRSGSSAGFPRFCCGLCAGWGVVCRPAIPIRLPVLRCLRPSCSTR